jgi:hypothetical protein
VINQTLHRNPVGVDNQQHRQVRMKVPVTDWRVASQLNAAFLTGVEFGDAAREFAIVFVRAGQDAEGKPEIAPIAVLGMVQNDNLYVGEDGQWRGRYLPASLATYPFAVGRIDDERFAVCMDAGWSGVSTTEGQALFDEAGEPTEFLKQVQQQLETLETETQRTRLLCRRLWDLGLLTEMRFDAKLHNGRELAVDGFLAVDEAKLTALPEADVVELHRNGLLGLVHAHFVSMGHMRRLLDWHVDRHHPVPAKA